MMDQSRKLRIGVISYTNVLPVTFFFDRERFAGRVEFIPQVPAQLNKAMAAGEIDVGPISSFSYAEHADEYLVLPRLSVSAKGRVGSIFLFAKRPIEQLDGARVALTNTSATSVNLLKVILQKFLGLTVSFETVPPHLPTMMERADAALLIGDDAIFANRTNRTYRVYDLGELWHQHTGYSMTFALWTVRKDAIRRDEDLLRDVYAEFLASKEKGLAERDRLVQYTSQQFGGTPAFWQEYFQGLTHEFGDEQRTGLEYYYAACASLGLLPSPVRVSLWEAAPVKSTFTS